MCSDEDVGAREEEVKWERCDVICGESSGVSCDDERCFALRKSVNKSRCFKMATALDRASGTTVRGDGRTAEEAQRHRGTEVKVNSSHM